MYSIRCSWSICPSSLFWFIGDHPPFLNIFYFFLYFFLYLYWSRTIMGKRRAMYCLSRPLLRAQSFKKHVADCHSLNSGPWFDLFGTKFQPEKMLRFLSFFKLFTLCHNFNSRRHLFPWSSLKALKLFILSNLLPRSYEEWFVKKISAWWQTRQFQWWIWGS